jgi:branched-chain amino acid transport system permease protein
LTSLHTPQFWYFWIGILLIAVVMFLPNGILGGLAKLSASWQRKLRAKAP